MACNQICIRRAVMNFIALADALETLSLARLRSLSMKPRWQNRFTYFICNRVRQLLLKHDFLHIFYQYLFWHHNALKSLHAGVEISIRRDTTCLPNDSILDDWIQPSTNQTCLKRSEKKCLHCISCLGICKYFAAILKAFCVCRATCEWRFYASLNKKMPERIKLTKFRLKYILISNSYHHFIKKH